MSHLYRHTLQPSFISLEHLLKTKFPSLDIKLYIAAHNPGYAIAVRQWSNSSGVEHPPYITIEHPPLDISKLAEIDPTVLAQLILIDESK